MSESREARQQAAAAAAGEERGDARKEGTYEFRERMAQLAGKSADLPDSLLSYIESQESVPEPTNEVPINTESPEIERLKLSIEEVEDEIEKLQQTWNTYPLPRDFRKELRAVWADHLLDIEQGDTRAIGNIHEKFIGSGKLFSSLDEWKAHVRDLYQQEKEARGSTTKPRSPEHEHVLELRKEIDVQIGHLLRRLDELHASLRTERQTKAG